MFKQVFRSVRRGLRGLTEREQLYMVVWMARRRRGMLLAQLVSSVCGDVVDSLAFLWLAFGSFALLAGQVVGKEEVTAVTVLVLAALRGGRGHRRRGVECDA